MLLTSYTFNPAGWVDETTDPRGLVTKSDYDNAGNTVATINDYTDGTPTNSSNQTTDFSYDGSGHVIMMIAVMPSGEISEETQYVYGATTSGGSNVDSNDLLAATNYPDLTSGEASSGQQESYTYNALGQETGFTDRDGNVHAYSFDLLGRKTLDAVTTLGSGVDGYVMAIGTAFNLQGLPYLYTSYSDADATTVVNQVENVYNGFGQLAVQYQEHSGAVDTSTTAKVQYGYSSIADGSRKTSLTYPDGRQIDYNYASGVDSDISRLTSIINQSSDTVLEGYKYLGLGTIIERDHPEDGVNLTYIGTGTGDAGDYIIGLDRFGRVVDQKWVTSGGTVKDEYQYGYDRDSNVLWKLNTVSTSNSELYAYDDLNRLVEFERGTLSSDHTSMGGDYSEETWTLDALGNQLEVSSPSDGIVDYTYNAQNEMTASSYGGYSYDANGNLLTNASDWNNYLYDAWNRNVGDADGGGASPIFAHGQTDSEQYDYDALGRRIYNAATGQDIYYDGSQRIEDVVTSVWASETADSSPDVNEYVWSEAYPNALVERDAVNLLAYGGGPPYTNYGSTRLYATQDADWNTTALIDASGDVVERYQYDPYGQVTYLDSSFTPLSTQASNYNWVYLFQGGVLDNDNLYWFENRDENPALGNWAEQDPAGYVDGADEYQFVGSSPIRNTDAAGLDSSGAIPLGGGGPPSAYETALHNAELAANQAAAKEQEKQEEQEKQGDPSPIWGAVGAVYENPDPEGFGPDDFDLIGSGDDLINESLAGSGIYMDDSGVIRDLGGDLIRDALDGTGETLGVDNIIKPLTAPPGAGLTAASSAVLAGAAAAAIYGTADALDTESEMDMEYIRAMAQFGKPLPGYLKNHARRC